MAYGLRWSVNRRIVIGVTVSPPDDDAPSYVHVLSAGADRSTEVTLATATMRELAQRVRDIEDARAAAAVSGRDYIIR